MIAPTSADWETSVWHVHALQHPERDALRHRLSEQGIQTGMHYPTPVHLQPAYAHLAYRTGDLAVAEDLAKQQISLPIYPDMTEHQVDCVAGAIGSFNRQRLPTSSQVGTTILRVL